MERYIFIGNLNYYYLQPFSIFFVFFFLTTDEAIFEKKEVSMTTKTFKLYIDTLSIY